MSGSSGGGGYVPQAPTSSCERIKEQTPLNSIVPNVLARVYQGDVLEVDINLSNGVPIIVVLHKGQVLGTVTSRALTRLLECIAEGHMYEAEIVQKTSSSCTVLIRHK